jgi:hypothetical protein
MGRSASFFSFNISYGGVCLLRVYFRVALIKNLIIGLCLVFEGVCIINMQQLLHVRHTALYIVTTSSVHIVLSLPHSAKSRYHSIPSADGRPHPFPSSFLYRIHIHLKRAFPSLATNGTHPKAR